MGPDAGTRPPLRQQGRDFLQAASNMASDVVAAPVDLISMGLRAAGVPVPENAVGGTQWQTERGLRREVPMGAARVLGETAGMASPAALFAKAPQVAAALNQAGRNLAAPTAAGQAAGQRGAIVINPRPYDPASFAGFPTSEAMLADRARRAQEDEAVKQAWLRVSAAWPPRQDAPPIQWRTIAARGQGVDYSKKWAGMSEDEYRKIAGQFLRP
jgi:hypothetical protein